MNETGAATTKDVPAVRPPRTWRPMILWTAAILAALGLAWFIGAVAVPVWQVRSVLKKNLISSKGQGSSSQLFYGRQTAVKDLGGEEEGARKMGLYLRLPNWAAPEKLAVIRTLSHCGAPARPVLIWALSSPDAPMREAAISAIGLNGYLGHARGSPPSAYPFANDDDETRALVSRALTGLLADSDPRVRETAAELLKQIRGPQPPK